MAEKRGRGGGIRPVSGCNARHMSSQQELEASHNGVKHTGAGVRLMRSTH